MKNSTSIYAFALVTALSGAGVATAEDGWKGNASLGWLASSGNTDTANLNAAIGASYTQGKWEHGLNLAAIAASDTGVTTAERYEARWKSKYSLTARSYVFGALDFDKDLFGGVRERWSEAVGYGYRVLNSEKHKLNFEIGAGARQIENNDRTKENDAVGRFGADYTWQFSPTANFKQSIFVETGSDNTYAESVTGVQAKLTTALALGVSYTMKHNSDVQETTPRTHHTDSYTAVTLNYAF